MTRTVKSALSALLSVIMITALFAVPGVFQLKAAAVNKLSITVETVEAEAGDTKVEVKVFIDRGWQGCNLEFNFDPSKLTYKSFLWNYALREQSDNGEPNAYVLNKDNADEGLVIVAFASAVIAPNGTEGYYPVDSEGNEYDYLGTFKFDVAEDAEGLQAITLTVSILSNKDGALEYTASNGGIQLPGDNHSDGPCNHVWRKWEVTTPATCVAKGERTRTCSLCKETETEEIDINPDAHNWGKWTPIEGRDGWEQRVCANNPEHIQEREISATGVRITVETVDAEAGAKNVEVKVFIDRGWQGCNFEFNFDPSKLTYKRFLLNYALREQSDNGEPNAYVLNREKAAEGLVIVAFATAVLVDGVECYYPVDSEGNEYDYLGTFKFDVAEDAEGLQGITLTVAMLIDKDGDDVAHTATDGGIMIQICDHDWVETSRTPATCTDNGNVTYTCSICQETKTEEIEINPDAHDWGEWTVTTLATCTTPGEEIRVCGNNPTHIDTRAIEIDSEAHDWIEIGRTSATCAAKGSVQYACSHNPEHTKKEVLEIDPEAHNWSEWEIVTPNTYYSTGVKARVCVRCYLTETRVIPVAAVTGMMFTALPTKTEYSELKDELDFSGAELTLYYDNNTSRTASVIASGNGFALRFDDDGVVESCAVTGFSNTVIGVQTIRVAYKTVSVNFNVEVVTRQVCGIRITSVPTKIAYDLGEPLNLNGAGVLILYDNGSSETASLMTIAGINLIVLESSYSSRIDASGFDSESAGIQSVTVEYKGYSDTFTALVGITKGDPDADGQITVADALTALRVAAQIIATNPMLIATCDTDADGEITVADALMILRVASLLIDPSSLG